MTKPAFWLLLPLWLSGGCEAPEIQKPSVDPQAATLTGVSFFREAAQQTGLDFEHVSGASGDFELPEIMGSGGALIDYDGDGDLDVYLVQSGRLGANPETQPGNQLFRNEYVPSGILRFSDVSKNAGVDDRGYGMGAAVGDIDGDGLPDLYVSNFGSNVLFHNLGNGRFAEVTQKTGTNDQSWSTSATFFDYDRDGDEDLFVTNYVHYSLTERIRCRTQAGALDYCAPGAHQAAPDTLLRNGGGVFTRVMRETTIEQAWGNGLGVQATDLNQDGWVDIYVANDQSANIYWKNESGKRFNNEALIAGVAFNATGMVEASMGITAGDVDNDGDEDLFMTHLKGETNTLYLNEGGVFTDSTNRLRLAVASLQFTGFGTLFFDVENDGDLDVFVANGAVKIDLSPGRAPGNPFRQHNQLFLNSGNGQFTDASVMVGEAVALAAVSRGALFGDLDNDGDIDIVINNNNGPVHFLQNTIGNKSNWLGVLTTTKDATFTPAQIALLNTQTSAVWRTTRRDGSYLASNDPRVVFSLPEDAKTADLGIIWPDGLCEQFTNLSASNYHTLVAGGGTYWNVTDVRCIPESAAAD